MNIKTDEDVLALDRTGLCMFLGLRSDNEQDANIEALENAALALLEEKQDDGEIVYEFDELDNDVQWRVVDFCRPDHQWWKDDTDFYQKEAVKRGLDMEDFAFDTGGQGGTAWWGGNIYLKKFLEANPPALEKPADAYKHEVYKALIADAFICDRVSVGHGQNHRYAGSTQVEDIEVDILDKDEPSITTPGLFIGIDAGVLLEGVGPGGVQDLQDAIEVEADDFAGWIYRQLHNTENHHNSLGYARDTCKANDWVFDKKGRLTDRPEPASAQAAVGQLSLAFETSGETL